MKRFVLFLALFFLQAQANLFYAQEVEEADIAEAPILVSDESERILNFHSDITIDKDGKVLVTEHIKVKSLGNKIQRGIFRNLPLTRNLNNRSNKVSYKIIYVKKNGADEPFREESENSVKKIYIGDKNIILSPGIYDYELQYSTKNQIGFFENYDEFYWNVNGADWDFGVDEISAKVTLPEGADILQNSCYTGNQGSKDSNCQVNVINSREISWDAKKLFQEEGLTIAVGFKKGIVLPPPPPTFVELYSVPILLGIGFLGFLFVCFSEWRKYGIDHQKPTVYPQFNSPHDLSPASIGYLKQEGYKENFVTAAIVNLAIKGFIKIEETEESSFLGLSKSKIFTLTKLKDSSSTLPREEESLMANLFSTSKSIKISGSYNSRIENAVQSFRGSLDFQHSKLLKEGSNASKLTKPIVIVAGLYLSGLIISLFLTKEFGSVIIGMFVLVGVAVISAILIYIVNQSVSFKFGGCAGVFITIFGIVFVGGFTIPLLFMSFLPGIELPFKACFVFLGLSAIALIIYSYLIKQPSVEKLRKQSLIEGFEMYMGAAENQQLKFHNPPQFTPELFEKYLPFAIVLGVDKIWGKKFENLLKQTSVDYSATWYSGGTMQPYAFGSMLNSSLTNSISSASTQPSSSSSGSGSSSSSGSGGGGFSGGGGGGGGGGGW